jgi:hypothetical protein
LEERGFVVDDGKSMATLQAMLSQHLQFSLQLQQMALRFHSSATTKGNRNKQLSQRDHIAIGSILLVSRSLEVVK